MVTAASGERDSVVRSFGNYLIALGNSTKYSVTPHRWPRLGVGEEPLVKVRQDLIECVVFVAEDRKVPGGAATYHAPIGTAFSVRFVQSGSQFPYFVTARHVLTSTPSQTIYIRARSQDGGQEDIPTQKSDWYMSDTADVAALPMVFAEPYWSRVRGMMIGTEIFVDADCRFRVPTTVSQVTVIENGQLAADRGIGIGIGDSVAFISLFSQLPGENAPLPVARFWQISAMPGEPIRMETFGGGAFEGLGYLVESHSWGGHSGAPAFWSAPVIRAWTDGTRQAYETTDIPALLGLVSAHFPIEGKAVQKGGDVDDRESERRIRTELNSGMAVVTPAAEIMNLFMREDLVQHREKMIA